MYIWFHPEIHDCHSGSDGKNTESIIELSLSEILPVNLVDRLYLQLLETNTAYLVGFGGHRKLIIYMWKTGRGDTQNLANWPVEFEKICHGKLWSLILCMLVGHLRNWRPNFLHLSDRTTVSQRRLFNSVIVYVSIDCMLIVYYKNGSIKSHNVA